MIGKRLPEDICQFDNRTEAGERLADRLLADGVEAEVVLGLPRGGIPVAAAIAARLAVPLAPLVVHKISAPGRRELAVGAVAMINGEVRTHRNGDLLDRLGVPPMIFDERREQALTALHAATAAYGGTPAITGRRVIVVDDGLATGATMLAAVAVLRDQGPAAVLVAVPVASPTAVEGVRRVVDRVICLSVPQDFRAVGYAYADFDQTSDAEVMDLLRRR